MRITVITPSIRPEGLSQIFKTLTGKLKEDMEWLPRLSVPREKTDLASQMNRAVEEAQGELIVFLQDWIKIRPDALDIMWKFYKDNPNTAWTSPVGKVATKQELIHANFSLEDKSVKWDWRPYRQEVKFNEWEIDWGAAPRQAIVDAGLFEERYDDGFGWENVDLAYRMSKNGVQFKCDSSNLSIALDHDAIERHPYKDKSNADLWQKRKEVIDLMYETEEN